MRYTRYFVLLFAVLYSAVTAQAQVHYMFYPKVSVDMPGKHFSEMSLEGVTKNTTTGITVGFEVISSPVIWNFSFGGGLSYQFPRKLDVEDYQAFQFATVYGIAKYRYLTFVGIECSVSANIGYNGALGGSGNYTTYSVSDGNDLAYNLLGGLYYAGGIRFDKDIYFIEAAYRSFGGTASSSSYSYDAKIHYRAFSLSVGVAI
jgi:hypothetical protein